MASENLVENEKPEPDALEVQTINKEILDKEIINTQTPPATTGTHTVSGTEEIEIGKKDISVKSVFLVLGGAILCWLMLLKAAR